MTDETINPKTKPFLIFNLLNKTPLKNNSSEIGAMIIAENISMRKIKGLLEPLTTSNKGKEIEFTILKMESKGKNMLWMKIATNMFEIAKIKTLRILLALNRSFTSLLKPVVPYVAIKKNTIIKQKKRMYSNSGEEILKYPSTNPVKKKEMTTAMIISQSLIVRSLTLKSLTLKSIHITQ